MTANHAVMALAQEKDGTLWLGTSGGGLYRRVGENVTRFGMDDGLASADVSRLLIDAEDRLWIGTHGGGLSWFHRGRLVSCTRQEGLPDDNVWQIVDDEAGHLWLGTSGGIVRLVKSDLDELAAGRRSRVQTMTLGRTDGFQPACRPACPHAAFRIVGLSTAMDRLFRPSAFEFSNRHRTFIEGQAWPTRPRHDGWLTVNKNEPRH